MDLLADFHRLRLDLEENKHENKHENSANNAQNRPKIEETTDQEKREISSLKKENK